MDKREMKRRQRREFTADFKSEAVRLCKVGDRTVSQVAKDLDLTETALREWVRRADIDAGAGPPSRSVDPADRSGLTQYAAVVLSEAHSPPYGLTPLRRLFNEHGMSEDADRCEMSARGATR